MFAMKRVVLLLFGLLQSVPLHYDKYVLDIDTLTDVNLWSLQVGKPHSEPGGTFTLRSMTPKGATVSIAIGAER
jgi:hypothetical protein